MTKSRNAAGDWQSNKRAKYVTVASRLNAELLNICLDSCDGMTSEATELIQAIGEEGERWSVGTWKSSSIESQLLSAIAVAVQRGNALTMLSRYTQAMNARSAHAADAVRGEGTWKSRVR